MIIYSISNMGRTYKRSAGARKYKSYDDRTLTEALQKVRNGQSLRSVSRQYGIPTGTLCNKMNKKHMGKAGGATVFSDREEQEMVDYIIKVSEWGFPMDCLDMRMLAKNVLERQGRERNGSVTISQAKSGCPHLTQAKADTERVAQNEKSWCPSRNRQGRFQEPR